MKKYAHEINQILDALINVYSDIKQYDKKRVLNEKIKKIKGILQEGVYDKFLITSVIEAEKDFLEQILESESLKDYDQEIIKEDLMLIDALWTGISIGILEDQNEK